MEPTRFNCVNEVVQGIRDAGFTFDGPAFFLLTGPVPDGVQALKPGDEAIEERGVLIDSIIRLDEGLEEEEAVGDTRKDQFDRILRAELLRPNRVAMFAHTHQTDGDPVMPGKHDIGMTVALCGLCVQAGTPMLDHILIGTDGKAFSFAVTGILKVCLHQALAQIGPFGIRGPVTIGEMETVSDEEDARRVKLQEAKERAKLGKLPPSKYLTAINERRAQEGKPPLQI